LAGPVVAGAVIFVPKSSKNRSVQGVALKGVVNRADLGVIINDSKKLGPAQRRKADSWIKENCLGWGIGEAPVSFINKHGIVSATRLAFRRAITECNRKLTLDSRHRIVDFLLVDAFYVPYTRGLRRKNQLAIIKGDQKSISIAAASIIAKVYRDNLMSSLARYQTVSGFAGSKYGWERNKGYGTREHQTAIRRWGPTRLHRKRFVRKLVDGKS